MLENDLSQAALARRVGTTGATLSRLFKGTQRPGHVMASIAELTGIALPTPAGLPDDDAEILHLWKRYRAAHPEKARNSIERIRRFVDSYEDLP